MLETLSEDFVRTARSKGASRRTVNYRHALRAAITPIVTIFGIDLGGQLGGVVITESTFNMQGVGRISVQAIGNLNLPVVMATVLIAATFIVIANVVVDMLYAVIDPRVRLS
jgi:peptide/nickel transport system permease protein